MGWLFMSRFSMGGHATPKAYLDDQFTGQSHGMKVLASSCLNNRVWYAAAQAIKNGKQGDIVALVCLIRWNPKARSGEHFGYKDMDETVGPCEAECPERILNLLTPTNYPHAIDWRARCRANLALRRRELRDGMRIKLASPLTFTDGYEGDEFTVAKIGGKLRFRRPDGHGPYAIRGVRQLQWSAIAETKVHKTVFTRAQ